MSVCLESNGGLASQGASGPSQVPLETPAGSSAPQLVDQPSAQVRAIAKLPVPATSLSKGSLITVLNAPLGNVKTLCVTPAVSSNATGQFTVVNSATPLNMSNSTGVKPQTITIINTPVNVVKTISPNVEKNCSDLVTSNSNIVGVPTLIENRGHNVFVKNTACGDGGAGQDVSQGHKFLTANNFPTNNVLTTSINTPDVGISKTPNGQRGKIKVLSNIVMPGSSQGGGNMLLNKLPTNTPPQRYVPRPKLLGPNNGTTTKYLNKPPNNLINKSNINPMNKQQPQKIIYPTHKSQIKTIPPVNHYMHGKPQGIKTLPAHPKGMPGHVQRTGSGLRTIPPQRPQKMPNKPNYIGKHAVQAQKVKPPHKLKNMKPNQMYNSYHTSGPMQEKSPLTFNQALTAEILETLSSKSGDLVNSYSNKGYENLPPRYDNAYCSPEIKPSFSNEHNKMTEERNKSGLDALSLICQAVLLDHNYNATLPPESPTRSIPPPNIPSQMNGVSASAMYSPGASKRRTLSGSNPVSANTSLSSLSIVQSNSNSMISLQEDDAASDISDGSDRKHDTEGEETDTAPEAEAVNNEDQFGDYVTRCICGFLHDDGYMIECDQCKVWQHVQCVVKNKQVPEEYLCEGCDTRKHVDRQKARMVQQQWLRERQFADPKLRKDSKLKEVFKHKEAVTDSDSSDGEHTGPNNNIVNKGRPTLVNRRKSDGHPKSNNTRQRRESAKEGAQRRQIKKREKKVMKRKVKAPMKNHSNSDDENHDAASPPHLPQLRQWIENYEEAVTNHYSPELRARISAIRVNGAHSDISVEYDSSVHKCRVHTQPLTPELKYLVSTVHLPPNTSVIELRGKYMLSIQHRNSGSSLNTRQHSQRPGPFLFFYRLHRDNTEVCVDTRTYGNSARFIRRSCKPNAELRHCIVKGVLHLYIVTITEVERNVELTIKHESHDLAAIGTTLISCACGNNEECTVNRTTIKKNGDTTEIHKKRRGRRTTSVSSPVEELPPNRSKRETVVVPPVISPVTTVKLEEVEVKIEPPKEEEPEVEEPKPVVEEEIEEPPVVEEKPEIKEVKVKEEEVKPESPTPTTPITTRRSSAHHKVEKEETKEIEVKEELLSPTESKSKAKKLSREERKLEAILKAIAQMEKADQRKQEHQAKQAHRRESEPGLSKEEEKPEPKIKRKRRKGRARTISTNTQSSRRNRLNSTDSYLTSGDETLLSPNDNQPPNRPSMKDNSDYKENSLSDEQNCSNKDVGLLLALSNGDNKMNKSPARETDSNSNSAQSSPETHLSSACLLVQAAVEPMEAGFKFPKTKKGLMNEWLNKVPEPVQSASSISPSSLTPHINTTTDYDSNVGFYAPGKNLVALAQVASFCDSNLQPRGNAKKRWLRQAISEDQCDSPSGRPESPPLSETVAPPKKRRLPRESLSNDITPPTTPTNLVPPLSNNDRQPMQEGCVEIVYSGADDDSPSQTLESDAVLEERAAEMKEEFSKCLVPSSLQPEQPQPVGCLMDPRLSRDHHHHIFSNSDHLVGTVEKTLSILGFEERKPEPITPAKRKLSITEYRQRKKLNNNDKCNDDPEPTSTEENNSSESFKPSRPRSDSTSSCASITSSDDEVPVLELTGKAPSAFNSEPTELERQREMTSLRLKKAFGIPVDSEPRKPALDVEAILNCEIPSVVKTIPPSPNFPIPGSCDVSLSSKPSPVVEMSSSPLTTMTALHSPVTEAQPEQVTVCHKETVEKTTEDAALKPNLFYTPDEEERAIDEQAESELEEIDTVDYVPPFNNPIYPNDSNFVSYASVIDEEGRYEGRNPSPPPDLEPSNGTFPGHQT